VEFDGFCRWRILHNSPRKAINNLPGKFDTDHIATTVRRVEVRQVWKKSAARSEPILQTATARDEFGAICAFLCSPGVYDEPKRAISRRRGAFQGTGTAPRTVAASAAVVDL
jgi:hypothetical protein